MADWLDRLGVLLLDASLSALVLLCLAALAMIGCRQPVRRIFLARAAILSVLALIPLIAFAPLPRIALDQLVRKSGFLAHPILSRHYQCRVKAPSLDSAVPPGAEGLTSARAALDRRLVGPPPQWLVILYLAGAGTVLGGLAVGHWGSNWLTSRSGEVSLAATELYTTLGASSGPRPRLRISGRVGRPVLVGLLRPTILIPAELDLPESRDELRLSLLHELAHIEGWDAWFSFLSGLAQAFWYFLPPLWWIRSQMRLDQEFMADRRAARDFGPFQSYAAGLLKIATGPVEPETSASAAPPRSARTASPSALFQRMLMLVQCPFPIESRPPRWWSGALAVLFLVATIAGSRLTLQVTAAPNVGGSYAGSTPKAPHTFRMARLVVNPLPQPLDHPQVYHLPVRLPDVFQLTVEVWGDSNSLPRTKVAGIPLSDPGRRVDAASSAACWHELQIIRSSNRLHTRLDQIPLPLPPGTTTTPSLTFEIAPDASAQFRNLLLTW